MDTFVHRHHAVVPALETLACLKLSVKMAVAGTVGPLLVSRLLQPPSLSQRTYSQMSCIAMLFKTASGVGKHLDVATDR